MPPGIEVRHSRTCRQRQGERCNCTPKYRARVWSGRDGRLITKTFPFRRKDLATGCECCLAEG
jgi:hypothetical protein